MITLQQLESFLHKPFTIAGVKHQFEKVDDDIIITRFNTTEKATEYVATVIEPTNTGIKFTGILLNSVVVQEIPYTSLSTIGIMVEPFSKEEFDKKIEQLGSAYEDAKTNLHSLSILDNERDSWGNLFELIQELRDIGAIALQKLHHHTNPI